MKHYPTHISIFHYIHILKHSDFQRVLLNVELFTELVKKFSVYLLTYVLLVVYCFCDFKRKSAYMKSAEEKGLVSFHIKKGPALFRRLFDSLKDKLQGRNTKLHQKYHTFHFLNAGCNMRKFRFILLVLFWGKVIKNLRWGKSKGINTEIKRIKLCLLGLLASLHFNWISALAFTYNCMADNKGKY